MFKIIFLVTSSMFVYIERDVRVHRRIPWYLKWLLFDTKKELNTQKNSFVLRRKSRQRSLNE